MPFRDPEWENLQRDCDIFPAYSDYIYGPDTRLLEVAQEPGLHPQIYPAHQRQTFSAPIRYTNSMPSRTWSYQTANGLQQSRDTPVTCQPDGHEVLRGQGLSRKDGVEVKLQMGSPASQLLPSQGVTRRISREEMLRRRMPNDSQQRSIENQAQQPVRVTRQQIQVSNAATLSSAATGLVLKPSFLRSSSTTDVDEMPTTVPMTLQNGPILPPNPFQDSPSAAPAPAPTAPQVPQAQIPLLRPGDMATNPRYMVIDVVKRKHIHHLLLERWNIARNATDQTARATAIMGIQQISLSVYKGLPGLENVALLQRQRQAMLAHDAQEGQVQYPAHAQQMQECNVQPAGQTEQMDQVQQMGQMQQAYAHPPCLPASSPMQSFRHPAQQPQYQPQRQYSAAQSPQQNFPQDFQLPHYSSQQAYQQELQHMQNQQQRQPQTKFSSPLINPNARQVQEQQQPQTALQALQSPCPNQSRTQASAQRPSPAQASAQLRANINNHLPQVWQCLQLEAARYQPTDPELIKQKQQAHAWLDSFKQSLPQEAHGYMKLVVSRMIAAAQQGRDPLAAVGIVPIDQQEGEQ